MNTSATLARPYRLTADAIHYVLCHIDPDRLQRLYSDNAAQVAAYEVHRALLRVTTEVAIRAAFEADFHKGAFYLMASQHKQLSGMEDKGPVPEFALAYVRRECARAKRYAIAFWCTTFALGAAIAVIIGIWPSK